MADSSEIDFWFNIEKYSDLIESSLFSEKEIKFNIDLIRLSSIRKSISNFIRILTRQDIPVYFSDKENNKKNTVYISSKINSKIDFDVSIGMALHEGAHILLTDFDALSLAWANIPSSLFKLSDSKGIRRNSFEKFLRRIQNIIEDRYIDNYIFNTTPGYTGYYIQFYKRFFYSEEIDTLLKSDEYRFPSLESYFFRISNLINTNKDLLALPRLDEIYNLIDFNNINRLSTTADRICLSYKVVEIVLDCLDKEEFEKKIPGKEIVSPDSFFNSEDNSEDKENSKSFEERIINEISDVISNKDVPLFPENKKIVNKTGDDNNLSELKESISEKQHKFLYNKIDKDDIDENHKSIIDIIDKNQISMVYVGADFIPDDIPKIECIVIKKLTKDLILNDKGFFPLSDCCKIGNTIPLPEEEMEKSVNKGIIVGKNLGKKLQIRNEVVSERHIRKKHGKINKRQLHEAAFDAEDIFFIIKDRVFDDATIHISVDASSSMKGSKWNKTITCAVAIAQASSMVNNIHVTISFRTSIEYKGKSFPCIILAYDSKKDRMSKIKNLFPYLVPNGCTPEGLAYEAVINLFKEITPDKKDRYFFNISDGEPYFLVKSFKPIVYAGKIGVNHTKKQIDNIKKNNVKILSYFIESDELINEKLKEDFKKMYGENSKFINVEDVSGLAKTINQLFLA